MAIRIQFESVGSKNIEAAWDGLPLIIRSEDGNSLLKIPAYHWADYGITQKIFWGIGFGALILF